MDTIVFLHRRRYYSIIPSDQHDKVNKRKLKQRDRGIMNTDSEDQKNEEGIKRDLPPVPKDTQVSTVRKVRGFLLVGVIMVVACLLLALLLPDVWERIKSLPDIIFGGTELHK